MIGPLKCGGKIVMRYLNGLLLGLMTILTSNLEAADVVRRFHGVRADDPWANGIANPERGFRLECNFGMGDRITPFGCSLGAVKRFETDPKAKFQYADLWNMVGFSEARPWGVTLAQHYVYLTEFYDTEVLPEQVLRDLEDSFEVLRKCGAKSVLRFSYETDTVTPWVPPELPEGMLTEEQIQQEKIKQAEALAAFEAENQKGPTLEIVLAHIRQLTPVLQKNSDLIFCMEMGFLGAWGEWHSMRRIAGDDWAGKSAVLRAAQEALGPERMVTMRSQEQVFYMSKIAPMSEEPAEITPETAFDGSFRSRRGWNNDAFMVPSDERWVFMADSPETVEASPLFQQTCRESMFIPMGGELWWRLVGGIVDGKDVILRLRQQHYDYLSLVHSLGDTNQENINMWMRTPITRQWLEDNNLPVPDGYFDYTGMADAAERSAFDYIRDCLGYRFELQNATWQSPVAPGEVLTLNVELVNRGFKSLLNKRTVYAVLLDRSGEVTAQWSLDCDPRRWFPHDSRDPEYKPLKHSFGGELDLPANLTPGKYYLALWLPDVSPRLQEDENYSVRFANRDVPWINGKNLLGILIVE